MQTDRSTIAIVAAALLTVALVPVATLSCSHASNGASADSGADVGVDASAAEAGDEASGPGGPPSCEGGTTQCGSTCVDTQNDSQHCGSCIIECINGATCTNGICCVPSAGGGVCHVAPACGCTADENCARIDGGPEQCVPNGTVLGLGECTSTVDCYHGLTCAHGLCYAPCTQTSECVRNYLCTLQSIDQGGQAVPAGYAVCLPHCNPVDPLAGDGAHVGCLVGQRCEIVELGTLWTTYCQASKGTLSQGAACSQNVDCAPGLGCFDDGSGTSTCRQMCRVGAFTDCPTGTCTSFTQPKYDTLGAYTQEIGSCQ